MDQRYQIFVSSTFRDLREERRETIQTLLEMNCIPAGMELFPAADDETWALIKSVIAESDYYVLIVGGRYGSVDAEGISYTEKEYQFAVDAGIPVLPFLHQDPGKIPAEHTELEPGLREKLEAFRAKIESAHHCKYWDSPSDLGGKVAKALNHIIRTKPAVGWVRADKVASPEMLEEMQQLRKRVSDLEGSESQPPKDTEHLAQESDLIPLRFTFNMRQPGDVDEYGHQIYTHSADLLPLTWADAFAAVGPLLLDETTESALEKVILEKIISKLPRTHTYHQDGGYGVEIEDDDFQAIKVQLVALGLIKKGEKRRAVSDRHTYWMLTPYGEHYLMRLRAFTRQPEAAEEQINDSVPT